VATIPDRQLPRGTLYVSLGQGAFLLSGYVLQMILARWLGPSLFGVFVVVMNVLVWVEITVNNGVPSALQKFLPDRSLPEPSVRRAAVRVQAMISVGVFLVLFLVAPWLAALLRDPALTVYLRLAFLDILAMGAYAYYRGVLNGWRAFPQLALTITAYSLTKLLVSSLLVYLGLGVQGALIGNVASSLGGLAVGFLWTRRRGTPEETGDEPPRLDEGQAPYERQIFVFVVPTILFTLASNVLLGLDLMIVKAMLADADLVGYYGAAANLANAPRLVLLAFSFTLLPSLSHAIAARDDDQTRHYLRQTIRLLALVLLPVIALVTSTARPLVIFVFSDPYQSAAPILTVLIFTYAAYTVYITLVTALLAENRPGWALAIPTALLPVALGAIWLGVSRFGSMGAAFASLLSVSTAAVVVGVYVFRRFRPRVNVRSLARIALASLAVWGGGRLLSAIPLAGWGPSAAVLLAGYALLAVLFLGLLLALGEIRLEDLALLGTWLSRPRKAKKA
jgi:O-antigen/teichoic acid export membrane protein